MKKFLCRWDNEKEKLVKLDFFTMENFYTEQEQFMIQKLRIGDVLDLSDGIDQVHHIERVS